MVSPDGQFRRNAVTQRVWQNLYFHWPAVEDIARKLTASIAALFKDTVVSVYAR